MKPFHFQKFSIRQNPSVFRVGTDGVLLGALSTVHCASRILEIGTGTGIVAMMLAQRNQQAHIDAVDINPIAAELAAENFRQSPFSERLTAYQQDYKLIDSTRWDKYSLIVSNPPYFERNASAKDEIARQQKELTFTDLVHKSASLLSSKGIFSVIIPWESKEYFVVLCERQHLHLQRDISIYGSSKGAPQRSILEFTFYKFNVKYEKLIIEQAPRVYSQEYLDLTKDFHLFKSSS